MSCGPTSELIPDTGGDCTFDGYLENIGVTGEADLLSDAVFVANYYGFDPPTAINDVCILEFDFVAAGDSMSFDYIFASSEYPSDPNNPGGFYVNTIWNDAFGFYLSGPGINGPYANNAVNIAGIPDPAGAGLLPITVSSVNGIQNTQYFIENTNLDGICMRGYTTVLTAAYNDLECGATYHIKLAIGDGTDDYLTSMVILGSETFESNAVVDINLNIDVGADVVNNPPVLYEDCGTATMVFSRPLETNLNLEESIEIVYSGTSTYGVDYTALPTTVTFPPNVSTQEFSISAVLDGVSEGPESLEMEILNLAACNGGGLTSFYEFNINDTAEPLQVDGFTTSLCTGDSVLLTPVISGGYGNFIFDWDCNPGVDTSEYNFLANAPGLFNCLLTVTDTCGMPSDDGFFEVDVVQYPAMTVDIGPDVLLPCNGNQTVLAAVTGGNPGAGG